MVLDGYSAERGQTRNPVFEAQLQQRSENLQRARNPAVRLCMVYDYDPLNQTVDVVLMDDRRAQPIRGVPIAGTGGQGMRVIRAWKGLLETDKPDIGYLLFPRLGGGRRFLDYIRRDVRGLYAHIEETAIFGGGLPATLGAGERPQENYNASPALHQIGKKDNGLLKPSGAGVLIKDNDDLVLRGRRIYLMGLEQTEANMDPVALQGGVSPPASSIVFSG